MRKAAGVVGCGPLQDNVLQSLAGVLDTVHQRFYGKHAIRCAPSILRAVKANILAGVHLVFSGVFPLNGNTNPKDFVSWRTAEDFGAIVHGDRYAETKTKSEVPVDWSIVTHVVAIRDGTDKVHEARRRGISVVHVKWLFQCFAHFVRVPEHPFRLKEAVSTSASSTPVSRPSWSVSCEKARIRHLPSDLQYLADTKTHIARIASHTFDPAVQSAAPVMSAHKFDPAVQSAAAAISAHKFDPAIQSAAAGMSASVTGLEGDALEPGEIA